MVFQKYDPRIQYFNTVIDIARDCGLVDYFFGKEMPPKNLKEPMSKKENALVLEHFQLPLIISAASITVALVIFICEKLCNANIFCTSIYSVISWNYQ